MEQRSLADPIEGEFDLIASLGAFEGVGEHEVSSALDAMCRSGKRIVFSSEPSRTAGEGPNARPTIHWLREFAGRGFAPKKTFDASFIAPHVFVLEGRSSAIEELDLVAFANRIRLSIQIFEDRQRIVQLQHSVRDMKRQNSDLSEQIARVSREEIALTSSHAWWLVTQFWRATSYPLVREVRHGVRKSSQFDHRGAPERMAPREGAEEGHSMSDFYGAQYFAHHCGPIPYERSVMWLDFFGRCTDGLIRAFAPKRVFDAGSAFGMLVEAFWDRGVEAYGRDISPYAISESRPDMAPYVEVGSITDPSRGNTTSSLASKCWSISPKSRGFKR